MTTQVLLFMFMHICNESRASLLLTSVDELFRKECSELILVILVGILVYFVCAMAHNLFSAAVMNLNTDAGT